MVENEVEEFGNRRSVSVRDLAKKLDLDPESDLVVLARSGDPGAIDDLVRRAERPGTATILDLPEFAPLLDDVEGLTPSRLGDEIATLRAAHETPVPTPSVARGQGFVKNLKGHFTKRQVRKANSMVDRGALAWGVELGNWRGKVAREVISKLGGPTKTLMYIDKRIEALKAKLENITDPVKGAEINARIERLKKFKDDVYQRQDRWHQLANVEGAPNYPSIPTPFPEAHRLASAIRLTDDVADAVDVINVAERATRLASRTDTVVARIINWVDNARYLGFPVRMALRLGRLLERIPGVGGRFATLGQNARGLARRAVARMVEAQNRIAVTYNRINDFLDRAGEYFAVGDRIRELELELAKAGNPAERAALTARLERLRRLEDIGSARGGRVASLLDNIPLIGHWRRARQFYANIRRHRYQGSFRDSIIDGAITGIRRGFQQDVRIVNKIATTTMRLGHGMTANLWFALTLPFHSFPILMPASYVIDRGMTYHHEDGQVGKLAARGIIGAIACTIAPDSPVCLRNQYVFMTITGEAAENQPDPDTVLGDIWNWTGRPAARAVRWTWGGLDRWTNMVRLGGVPLIPYPNGTFVSDVLSGTWWTLRSGSGWLWGISPWGGDDDDEDKPPEVQDQAPVFPEEGVETRRQVPGAEPDGQPTGDGAQTSEPQDSDDDQEDETDADTTGDAEGTGETGPRRRSRRVGYVIAPTGCRARNPCHGPTSRAERRTDGVPPARRMDNAQARRPCKAFFHRRARRGRLSSASRRTQARHAHPHPWRRPQTSSLLTKALMEASSRFAPVASRFIRKEMKRSSTRRPASSGRSRRTDGRAKPRRT